MRDAEKPMGDRSPTTPTNDSDKELGKAATPLPDNIDPELERRITRKLDLHILPWLFGIWLFAFIDRSSIGNAKIDGFIEDLHLDGNKFNITLAVFYILYVLIDVPSNWILKAIGAGTYLPALIIGWAICGVSQGLSKNFATTVALRMLLGLFEGGLFGGMILYLSMFYRRYQMLLRIGLWYSAAPFAGAIGGLLAAGISQITYHGYNHWPWIFIIEASTTFTFGWICLFFLPHTPAKSKFLTEEEREGAVLRLQLDHGGAGHSASVDYEKFSWHWVKMAAANINTWLCCFNFFTILVPIYSYSLFLPTIINSLGYKALQAQLLTVPPNFCAVFSVIASAYFADKYKVRGPFILAGSCIGLIGYIILITAEAPLVRYGGTFFVAFGVFQNSPAVNAWLNNNLAPHYVRATGSGMQVGIGNCAAFLATFTYLSQDAPRYVIGHSINLGILVLTIIITLITMAYVRWENRKRERGERDYRLTEGDPALLGHRHPNFRYTT